MGFGSISTFSPGFGRRSEDGLPFSAETDGLTMVVLVFVMFVKFVLEVDCR
jgi:hypothetical protein